MFMINTDYFNPATNCHYYANVFYNCINYYIFGSSPIVTCKTARWIYIAVFEPHNLDMRWKESGYRPRVTV